MLGYEDAQVRAFDMKMRVLAEECPQRNLQTFLMVERAVGSAQRGGVEIGRLRLGHEVFDALREDYPNLEDRLFGYEVEVSAEEDVIEVVATADDRVLVGV